VFSLPEKKPVLKGEVVIVPFTENDLELAEEQLKDIVNVKEGEQLYVHPKGDYLQVMKLKKEEV